MSNDALQAALRSAQERYVDGALAGEVLPGLLGALQSAVGSRASMVVAVDAEGRLSTLLDAVDVDRVRDALEGVAWKAAAAEVRIEREVGGVRCLALPAFARGRVVGVVALAEPGPEVDARFDTISAGLSLLLASETTDRRDVELTRLFDFSLDMLCTASFDGYFQRVNPAFSRTLGYTADELRARPFLEFVHPDDVDATLAEMSSLDAGATTLSFTNRYRHRDGHYLWLAWRAYPHDDGFIYAVARDVNEERRAEARQARLVAIIEQAADLVWITDGAGRLTFVNRAGRARLGLGEGDIERFDVVDLFDTTQAGSATLDSLPSADRDGVWRGESVLRGADATPIPVSLITMAHGKGDDRYFSTVARDISAQKQVQRLQDEFISMVSHELRTPLTSIRGSLGLLEGGVVGQLPPKATMMVGIARSNTDRLIRLINDILDLEKLEAGRMELILQPVVTKLLVERTLNGLAGMAHNAEVELKSDITASGPLEADPDRLVQVLTNLVGNAIKFSPRGGTVRVQVRGRDQVRFSVIDEGPGIPADLLERVFERFEQVDASDSRAKGGSGLGLAICKAIVEQHDGRIWVESEPGEGSQFHFEVPGGALPLTETPVTLQTQRHSVLLVEDDDDLARVLALRLEHAGYAVFRAPGVESAWRTLRRRAPDALVLDLKLEDGDGFELLRRVRAHAALRDLPVVIMSGHYDRAGGGQPDDAWVDWLQKPFSEGRLVGAVWRAVRAPGPATALVVEDDPDGREVVVSLLESAGLRCVTADSGPKALASVEKEHPDLIVLDVGLPEMDGFGLVEALRREKARATPLLVYTGRDLNEIERRALRLGVTRHLVKARATEDDFFEAVSELLDGLLPDRERAEE